MKLEDIILVDGERYRVVIVNDRYLGCELVSNPKLKRTVDTLTADIKKL